MRKLSWLEWAALILGGLWVYQTLNLRRQGLRLRHIPKGPRGEYGGIEIGKIGKPWPSNTASGKARMKKAGYLR